MESPAADECACGSGLPFSRCHGDPANEFARVQALREAEGIAWMFPSVRVTGTEVESFADRVALEQGSDEDVSETILEQGLALVDDDKRMGVVELWAAPYADRWASLIRASGDADAAERALVAGALRAAIAERQPTPRELVEPLDDGALRRSPFAALSVVLPPMFVWSVDEARAAEVAASQRRGRHRTEAVEEVAYALMTFAHIRRTSDLVARLAAELPFAGLPEASRTLVRACGEVEQGLDAARATTAALLIAYVEQRRQAA
jgi:hypothetical protein